MMTIATAADLSQAMRELPWADLSPVIGLGLIGLGLWLVGRRFMRAGLVMAAVLIGATTGWIIWELLLPPFSPWILVGVGAVLLACLAILTFRFAVAGTLAIVLGLAAPALVWTIGDMKGATQAVQQETGMMDSDSPDSQEDADVNPDDAEQLLGDDSAEAVDAFLDKEVIYDTAKEQIPKLRGYSEWAVKTTSGIWKQTPPELRPQMIGASVVGVLAGFLLGTFIPTLSASVVASFGGSMLLLICIRVISERLGIHDGWWMPAKATPWLVLWLIASIIGIGIQWTFRAKPADNAA